MKRKTLEKLIFVVVISLSNYWIWRVFSQSYLLAAAMVLLSILLVFRLKAFTIVVLVILSVFLMKKNLW